jgi:hypothetical protein
MCAVPLPSMPATAEPACMGTATFNAATGK